MSRSGGASTWPTMLTAGALGVSVGAVAALQTQQRQREVAVTKAELDALSRATTRLLRWLSGDTARLASLAQLVEACVSDLVPCERVTLFCVDRRKHELWAAGDQGSRDRRVPSGRGVLGRAALSGEVQSVDDVEGAGGLGDGPNEEDEPLAKTMLCVPVLARAQGEVLGVLCVVNRTVPAPGSGWRRWLKGMATMQATAFPFGSQDEQLLQSFGLQVGAALRKCALQGTLYKILVDSRLESEERLALSHEQSQGREHRFAADEGDVDRPRSRANSAPPRGATDEVPENDRRSRKGAGLLRRATDARVAWSLEKQDSLLREFMDADLKSNAGLRPEPGSTETAGGSHRPPRDPSSAARRSRTPSPVRESDGRATTPPAVAEALRESTENPEVANPNAPQDRSDTTTWPVRDLAMPGWAGLRRWDLDILGMSPATLLHCSEVLIKDGYPAAAPELDDAVLRRFLLAIFHGYHNHLPFHTFRHGVSVLHVVWNMLRQDSLRPWVSSTQRFALLVAALCHDVGHPGMTNGFLVASSDPIAYSHNDDAVLERYHSATAFEISSRPGHEIFAGLDRRTFQMVRRCIIEAILDTDMARHFGMLQELQDRSRDDPWNAFSDEDWRPRNTRLVLRVVVHAADLSGQAQPWPIASAWGDRVLAEFSLQAAAELKHGLPPTRFMHGLDNDVAIAKLQQGFVENIVLPLWQGLAVLAPELQYFAHNAAGSLGEYKKMLASAAAH